MPRLTEANRMRRLLWLDHDSYSAPLLTGDAPPWLDSAACVAWVRHAHGLLRPDVLTLPLADLADAWLARDSALGAEMVGKTKRTHLPLKTCLSSEPVRAYAAALAVALRTALPGAIFVLDLPSPRDWAARAFTFASGMQHVDVDEDAADAAAACVADFLRGFATAGVDAVLMRESQAWDADTAAHGLERVQPVVNVARHYGWDWGMRMPAPVAFAGVAAPDFSIAPAPGGGGLTGVLVPAAFWHGEDDLPAAQPDTFDVAAIPAAAHPETVLARIARLRERQST
ncbi:hypothetical protein [Burkholderia cepacia]|uniref:Uncharacterized protein n=1 Tax=Burkholderia cepacia GG4 TaxID=1009846 RepID=A0A9W3K2P9_BURCE|nr:hypothetical protein [Burkholderia cepacia]AFQ49934.1 hypothetical protein GEM_3543 [Burkholderia cepacia GG4]